MYDDEVDKWWRDGAGGMQVLEVWCSYTDGVYCFFFNDTATTEIYTLSLHDALPILLRYTMTESVSSSAKEHHHHQN